MMENKGFGCKLSPIDLRDYQVRKASVSSTQFPTEFKIDMSGIEIKNQRYVNSCVAHAMSSILEYFDNGRTSLSTNFIYGIPNKLWNSEGPGMYLREACEVAHQYGDMTEEDCPGNNEISAVYKIANDSFTDEEKLKKALNFKISLYTRLWSVDEIKYALINFGPVLSGVKWYDIASFDKETKLISFDTDSEYGYHSVVIYGWDKDGWLCRNSWGKNWGYGGLFKLRYSDGPRESFGLLDDPTVDSDSIVIPSHNKYWINKILKLFNKIINLLIKRK